MSDPRALPDEERPFVPDEEIWEDEEGQQEPAPEDEPDAFSGDEEPLDPGEQEA